MLFQLDLSVPVDGSLSSVDILLSPPDETQLLRGTMTTADILSEILGLRNYRRNINRIR